MLDLDRIDQCRPKRVVQLRLDADPRVPAWRAADRPCRAPACSDRPVSVSAIACARMPAGAAPGLPRDPPIAVSPRAGAHARVSSCNWSCSISALPLIEISRLLKSWATPAVSRPIAAIVCACRRRSSASRRAVTSRYSVTKPPPGRGLRRISSWRPPGRERSVVPMLAPERINDSRRATSAFGIDGAELAAGDLAAQDVLHRQPDAEDFRRHAGELRESAGSTPSAADRHRPS